RMICLCSSRRRHTRWPRDWSSDVCSSDLTNQPYSAGFDRHNLVTLGIMSKNDEFVAIKASGISLFRVAVPLLLAGLAVAGTLLVLDDTYLPYANQRQDALHNQIKGRPPQTYAHPQRWMFGEDSKIY